MTISDRELRRAWRHVSNARLLEVMADPRESEEIRAIRRRVAVLRGLISSPSPEAVKEG